MKGPNRLTPFWRLGICNVLFFFCSQFANIFINIYVFQQFHSLRVIGFYNAIMYVTWILAFTIGSKLWRKWNRLHIPFAGLLGIVALAFLIAIPKGNLWLDLSVGGVVGLSSGFYYVAYNLYLFAFSQTGERVRSIARLSVMTSLVAVAMPAISGNVVNAIGFTDTFGLIIALYVAMFWLSLGFGKVDSQPVSLRDAVKCPTGSGVFFIALVSTGVYIHFLPFAAGVLAYSYGSGVKGAGWLNALYATLTFLANVLIGYGIRARSDDSRQKVGWIGAGLATVSTLLLFGHQLGTVVAFNILVSLANPLFFSLMSGQQFDTVGRMYANHATGFLVREWFYTFARVSVFLYVGISGMKAGTTAYAILVCVLCVAPLSAVYWNRRAHRREWKEELDRLPGSAPPLGEM